LMEGVSAQACWADKGYDSEAVNFSPGYLREGKITRRGPHGEI
jgi:hypothetical protein